MLRSHEKQGAQKLVVQFPDQMFGFNLTAQGDYLGLNHFQTHPASRLVYIR